MLNYIKRILFATYVTDRKLFKIRNRILLSLILIVIFKLTFFNYSDLTTELAASDKEQVIVPVIEEKVKEPVSVEDVKKILNGTYSELTQPATEIKQDSTITKGQFIIVLLTTKKSENIDSFKDKYSKINFKEYINIKGEKILFIGPYEGLSIAKKDLELNKSLIPEDSFIANVN